MKVVNQPVMKKDAMSLVTGKPVFLDDVVLDKALVVKVKRSPYAHALIEEIKIDTALKVPGIEAIYTYKDVPNIRFTMAGQTYPEPSPYDRLILDQRVRFVGDAVAIVAEKMRKPWKRLCALSRSNIRSWSRCWISTRRRTIRFWCIRKITGSPNVR